MAKKTCGVGSYCDICKQSTSKVAAWICNKSGRHPKVALETGCEVWCFDCKPSSSSSEEQTSPAAPLTGARATPSPVPEPYQCPEAPEAPAFSPLPGSYSRTTKVTLSSATPGAQLFYTLDGTEPSPSGETTLAFLQPILLPPGNTYTVKAVAESQDLLLSPVATGVFFIDISVSSAARAPPKAVSEEAPALTPAALPAKSRRSAPVDVNPGGPLPIQDLMFDDPPPPGLTCKAVFLTFHSLKGVSEFHTECLLTLIINMLEGKKAVEDTIAQCGLSPDEAFAVAWYAWDLTKVDESLGDKNAWKVANEVLRKRNPGDLRKLQLIPWLHWLVKGLRKLPVWQGTAYRGLSVPLLELSSNYVPDKTVTWTAFTSTTTDRDITMREFAHSNAGGTFVQVEVAEARDISAFSPFPEQERLLLPNSTFTVVKTLAYKDAVAFFKLSGTVDHRLPENTDMILLQQIETPWIGKLLQPRLAPS